MLAGTSSRVPTLLGDLLSPELAARLDGLDVLSRKVFSGKLQGERRSKRRGRSVEFDDYREYVAGDDLRHIDWNVLARLDRFFIKVFQEEEDLALNLILDVSASMHAGSPSKVILAARLAMALGYIGLVNNNRVTLSVIGSGAPVGSCAKGARLARLAPVRGRPNIHRLASFILDEVFDASGSKNRDAETDDERAGARIGPGAEFTSALKTLGATSSGKGVTVLISDLLIPRPEGYKPGLAALSAGAAAMPGRAGSQDLFVVQVLSPGELDPAKEGVGKVKGQAAANDEQQESEADRADALLGDVRLTDVETGRVAEVTITNDLMEQYRRSVKAYIEEAAAFCTARGATHLLVTSDADPAQLVLDALRRRGLLG